MNVKDNLMIACLAMTICVLASPVFGQVLYSQDFDANDTANWTVNSDGLGFDSTYTNQVPIDTHADFYFDYSSVGIPPAPNSTGGSTRGMKLQVNLTSDAFGGFSVSPTGQSFSGDYSLTFDMWSNYNGPLDTGGSGSTQLSYGGVLTDGHTEHRPGNVDGVFFAYSGDGGSSADYRIYSVDLPMSYQIPDRFPGDLAGEYASEYIGGVAGRNNTTPYYLSNINPLGDTEAPAAQLALYPNQTSTVRSGAAGMTWREWEITKVGDLITWFMDDIEMGRVDLSLFVGEQPTGGNILFGCSDINYSSPSDPDAADLLFTLVDNVRVQVIPEPATLSLLALSCFGLLSRRVGRRGA